MADRRQGRPGQSVVVYDLEELTASALGRLIAAGVSTAIVPFGSLEHHGAHLPIGADAVVADAVGRQVARGLDAVVAVARFGATSSGAVVCAPAGDVGPSPGAHSGEWLTSVMLALRPDLVEL